MAEDEDWEVPREFEAPEGNYTAARSGIGNPQLSGAELAEPAPIAPKFCITTIKGAEGDGLETQYTAVNVRKVLYFHRNNEERPIDMVQYNRQPKESPTSHDINLLTRSPSTLQALIGFTCSEIVVHDAFAKRSSLFNRGGEVSPASVTVVRWIPGFESLFIAAFADGGLYVFDTGRSEVQPLKPPKGSEAGFQVSKSKTETSNPVSQWHLSDHKGPIFDLAFSPDCSHFAVVGRDGRLRVLNFKDEKEVCTLSSYYGALTCVSWSPDGKFLLTGGQDDLVSIWSLDDLDIVARCQGHNSWITSVSFDRHHSDAGLYRIGSVAQDTRLCLWDFLPHALSLPRQASYVQQASAASPKQSRWRRRKSKHGAVPKNGKKLPHMAVQPARGKAEVPMLEPVVNVKLHYEPITDMAFLENSILTVCQSGCVMAWMRPEKIQATAV